LNFGAPTPSVVALAPRLAAQGITIAGVRIDSGNLGEHARRVRRILDDGGLPAVKIVASGGLDEDTLLALSRAGAPIDSYGIGTSLTTASDAPALDCAYKLQEYAGTPRRKRSEGKATWPGRKQVWRSYDDSGRLAGDIVSLSSDRQQGEALLRSSDVCLPPPARYFRSDCGVQPRKRSTGTAARTACAARALSLCGRNRRAVARTGGAARSADGDRRDGRMMGA
jgi:nicotinate phosphoribosyltransferase